MFNWCEITSCVCRHDPCVIRRDAPCDAARHWPLSLSDALQFDWHWSVSPPTNLYITSFHIYMWKLFSVQYPSPHPLQTCCWCVSIYSIYSGYSQIKQGLSKDSTSWFKTVLEGHWWWCHSWPCLWQRTRDFKKIPDPPLVLSWWCEIWPGQCPLAPCYPDQCPPWLGPAWLCLTEMCNKTVTNH